MPELHAPPPPRFRPWSHEGFRGHDRESAATPADRLVARVNRELDLAGAPIPSAAGGTRDCTRGDAFAGSSGDVYGSPHPALRAAVRGCLS